MTSPRRYPLVVGGRCRHMDGREGTITAIPTLIISTPTRNWPNTLRVIWDDGGESDELPGFLEAVPSEFAP